MIARKIGIEQFKSVDSKEVQKDQNWTSQSYNIFQISAFLWTGIQKWSGTTQKICAFFSIFMLFFLPANSGACIYLQSLAIAAALSMMHV